MSGWNGDNGPEPTARKSERLNHRFSFIFIFAWSATQNFDHQGEWKWKRENGNWTRGEERPDSPTWIPTICSWLNFTLCTPPVMKGYEWCFSTSKTCVAGIHRCVDPITSRRRVVTPSFRPIELAKHSGTSPHIRSVAHNKIISILSHIWSSQPTVEQLIRK